MSVNSIGSGGSQLWQILRESRSQPSTGTSSSSDPSATASSTAAAAPASAGLSGSEAKLVTDLNSLLLDLQSDGIPSSAAASVSDSGKAAAESSDLTKGMGGLSSEFRRAGGHHHAHHGGEAAGQNPLSKMTSALSAYSQQLGLTANASSTAASVNA